MTSRAHGSISSDTSGFKVENSVVYINPVYLNYYRGYSLIFRVWDNSNDYTDFDYMYQFIPYSAVIENGQIISSGDTTFNGQDLAQYLPQAIIGTAPSGDSAGSGMLGGIANLFTNLYKKLFTFSGDYIENKLENLKNNNILPSGDAELEKAFIDLINNNNEDFRISWQSYTPNLSVNTNQVNFQKPFIESGEVNFSKLERENQGFQEAMTWTRTILGFSLGALLLKNIWRTTVQMFGIGYSIYNTDKDEKEIAKRGDK